MPLTFSLSPLSSPRDGSQSSFNSKCGGLQCLSRRCPNTRHLQCCGLVHAHELRQVLWSRYADHSRLFRSLALIVVLRDTHRAGTWKSGSVGISFPKASYQMQLEFLERNAPGYVCNLVPQRNERFVSVPHFLYLPAFCFLP